MNDDQKPQNPDSEDDQEDQGEQHAREEVDREAGEPWAKLSSGDKEEL